MVVGDARSMGETASSTHENRVEECEPSVGPFDAEYPKRIEGRAAGGEWPYTHLSFG